MTNPTQANVRIKAKGMYEDERELLGMLKASYKDYWETKNDGKRKILFTKNLAPYCYNTKLVEARSTT